MPNDLSVSVCSCVYVFTFGESKYSLYCVCVWLFTSNEQELKQDSPRSPASSVSSDKEEGEEKEDGSRVCKMKRRAKPA